MTVQRPLCDRGWSLQLTLLVSQLGVVLLILAAVCMPSLAELSAPSGGCTADSCGATPTTLDGNANGSGLRLDADAGIVCSAAVPPPTRVFVPAEPKSPDDAAALRTVDYNPDLRLHLLVRASPFEHGFDRFRRSAVVNQLHVTVLSQAAETGSDELKEAVRQLSVDKNAVVMYIQQSHDVLLLAEATELLRKFQDHDVKILFGARQRCGWYCAKNDYPDATTAAAFLDPFSFIGYSSAVADFLNHIPVGQERLRASDVDFIHTVFFNAANRKAFGIKLDSAATIFLNLDGMDTRMNVSGTGSFRMDFTYNQAPDTRLFVGQFDTYPAVVRGGGNHKLFGAVARYAPLVWRPDEGCIACGETDTSCLDMTSTPAEAFPKVLLYLRVGPYAPFLDVVLQSLSALSYPRSRMGVVVFVAASASHSKYKTVVDEWLASEGMQGVLPVRGNPLQAASLSIVESYRLAVEDALGLDYDHLFYTDAKSHLNNTKTLAHLVMQQRPVVAPKLTEPNKYFSNFWGSGSGDFDTPCYDQHSSCKAWAKLGECSNNIVWMTENCRASCEICTPFAGDLSLAGYQRSPDYLSLVERERLGVWDVPYVFSSILFNKSALKVLSQAFSTYFDEQDGNAKLQTWGLDLVISQLLRQLHVPLFVSNLVEYGHLINLEGFNESKAHPDLFMIEHNPWLWEQKYVHPQWPTATAGGWAEDADDKSKLCWDIYQFPLLTKQFASDLIAEAEACGEWSGGQYNDKRLKGGYEPVPTQDIHFKQFGFSTPWYHVMKRYVAPVAEHHWTGYTLIGKQCLDFIVKYDTCPTCQPSLRPHFDASTFSINVALNQGGVDFIGGGTRFTRQNCTVRDNPIGHALIHPGRLTHQHEGLAISSGRRYIIVTFVDQS